MALAKLAELEAEYARTQKNKATEMHLGGWRRFARPSPLARQSSSPGLLTRIPPDPSRPAGILKSKIAKLKSEIILGPKSAGSSKPGDGFDVTRFGDTRVGLIGFPSVGKSTLLNVLTGGKSESAVAAYEFTTLTW